MKTRVFNLALVITLVFNLIKVGRCNTLPISEELKFQDETELALPEVFKFQDNSIPDPDEFLTEFLDRFSETTGTLEDIFNIKPLSYPSIEGSPIFDVPVVVYPEEPEAEDRSLVASSIWVAPFVWVLNMLWFLVIMLFSKKTFMLAIPLLFVGWVFNFVGFEQLAGLFNDYGNYEWYWANGFLERGSDFKYSYLLNPTNETRGPPSEMLNRTSNSVDALQTPAPGVHTGLEDGTEVGQTIASSHVGSPWTYRKGNGSALNSSNSSSNTDDVLQFDYSTPSTVYSYIDIDSVNATSLSNQMGDGNLSISFSSYSEEGSTNTSAFIISSGGNKTRLERMYEY